MVALIGRCSISVLVKPAAVRGIQCSDLQWWTSLSRSLEKRLSVHGSRRRQARHQSRIYRIAAWVIDLFQDFFRESSCLVWSGEAAAFPKSWNTVLPALSLFRWCASRRGGHVDPCIRRVFRDPIGFGFWWIRLDSADFHGFQSFYMPLSVFFSPGQTFASQIALTGFSLSASMTSRALLLQAPGVKEFAPPMRKTKGCIKLCSRRDLLLGSIISLFTHKGKDTLATWYSLSFLLFCEINSCVTQN